MALMMSLAFVGACMLTFGSIYRWREREMLILALFYTYGTLHWGLMASLAFANPSVATAFAGTMLVVLSAVNLWAAHKCWDRWNRRRRKPQRKAGRVVVRLGRLAVVHGQVSSRGAD